MTVHQRFANNIARSYLNYHPELPSILKIDVWRSRNTISIDIDIWKLSIIIRFKTIEKES